MGFLIFTWVAVSIVALCTVGPIPTYRPLTPSCLYMEENACNVCLYLCGVPGLSACCLTFTRSVGVAIALPSAPKAMEYLYHS